MIDEHFCVEVRKAWFETIHEMQKTLDDWLVAYNGKRPYQIRGMNGRVPLKAVIEVLAGKSLALPQKPKGDMPVTDPKQTSISRETRAA